MGFFYWGEENNPNKPAKPDRGWLYWGDDDKPEPSLPVRAHRVSSLSHGHAPRKAGERTDRYGKLPVTVRYSWWSGWAIHDGNDRLYYARQRGDTWIDAEEM